MRILLYGFDPYQKYKENISKHVIRKIKGKNLIKKIFPVAFDRKMFLDAVKIKPDVIIGIGQCPRGKKIRIERKAVNLMKISKKASPRVILKNKPRSLPVSLKLKKDKDSWISYDAGTYVCNFSMFILCDHPKFAFIHIPKDYDLDKGIGFVEAKLEEISRDIRLS